MIQLILDSSKNYFLVVNFDFRPISRIIWTCPKQFGAVQTNLMGCFEPKEGQARIYLWEISSNVNNYLGPGRNSLFNKLYLECIRGFHNHHIIFHFGATRWFAAFFALANGFFHGICNQLWFDSFILNFNNNVFWFGWTGVTRFSRLWKKSKYRLNFFFVFGIIIVNSFLVL